MPDLCPGAPSVNLFTADEYLILCDLFGVDNPCSGRSIEDALDKWGIPKRVNWYRRTDAAVAQILLERVQDRLPNAWTSSNGMTRRVSGRRAHRKIEVWPTHLFTINWADSAPGLSWPVAYHATYVPGFRPDRGDGVGRLPGRIWGLRCRDRCLRPRGIDRPGLPQDCRCRLVCAAEQMGPAALGVPVRHWARLQDRSTGVGGRGLARSSRRRRGKRGISRTEQVPTIY